MSIHDMVKILEKILEVPDIINPFKVKSGFSISGDSWNDLGLETLLRRVRFSGNSRYVAEDVLRNLIDDHETITYRQDVFEELTSNEGLRKTVDKLASDLYILGLRSGSFEHEPSLNGGLSILRDYISCVNDLPNLDSANSKALRDVYSHFISVRNSTSFREMCEWVKRIEEDGRVTFDVSLDKMGKPKMVYALKLIERNEGKQPGSGEIGGHAFWDSHGLNGLGEAIYGLIEFQFIPVLKKYSPHVAELIKLANQLSFYTSFSRYFIKLRELGYDVCRPTILPKEERRAAIVDAKNPLISVRPSDEHGRRGYNNNEYTPNADEIIPNNIEHNPNANMLVITGPGDGGKTTYIRTKGLFQAVFQGGLLVPAKSARVSCVDGIYTFFVREENSTSGVGRYRSELREIKDILERASPFSLVILNELSSGTDYNHGLKKILEILGGFHMLGTTTYFTTHIHPIAEAVENGRFPAARNLSVECIIKDGKITYPSKIRHGLSGGSYGEEIAKVVGLSSNDIPSIVLRGAEKKGYVQLLRK